MSTTTKKTRVPPTTEKQQQRRERRQKRKLAKKLAKIATSPTTPSPAPRVRARKRFKVPAMADTRLVAPSNESLIPANEQPAIRIEVPLNVDVLYGVCLSYLSAAYSRGYLARAASSDEPYLASVYLLNIFLAYIKSSPIQAVSLPLWVQQLGQALAPKTVKHRSGSYYYRFATTNIDSPYVPPSSVPIGYAGYPYEFAMFVQTTGDVDKFPKAAPPTGWDEEKAKDSWTTLAQIMQVREHPASTICLLQKTAFEFDTSAFAMPAVPSGSGFGQSGGTIFQAGLETGITTPMLSVFANFINAGVNPVRYGTYVNTSSGDPLWASTMLSMLCPEKYAHTKQWTHFHPVDFLQICDVLAQWVVNLQNTALKSTSTVASVSGTPTALQCPITLQEFQLVIRNELMSLFGITQAGVQSIYPRGVSAPTANEFVPLIADSCTASLGTTGLKLPIIVVENMKALMGRWVLSKDHDPVFFAPILGKYEKDNLNPEDYVYTDVATNTSYPAFVLDPPVLRRRRMSKGPDTWEPTAEVPINMVDGIAGSDRVFINDQKRLTALTTLFNEWVQNYSNFSVALAVLSRELGVNICSSVGITRHWVNQTPSEKLREISSRDLRLEERKELSATIYASRDVVAVSSFDRMYDSVVRIVTNNWILPINYSNAGSIPNAQTEFTRAQIMNEETASLALASEDAGTSMSVLNARYASLLIRAPTAAKSEIEQFFTEQATNGTGGILSGLVAGFIGKAFGPTAGSIAGTVAELLPM